MQKQQNQSKGPAQKHDKKNTLPNANLPNYISFTNQTDMTKYQEELWPMNQEVVIDFFPKAKVPVTYIDSTNNDIDKYLQPHKQQIVLIDLEWTPKDPLSLFLICSCKGLLIIHNSGPSDSINNFIKSTPFYTKGSYKKEKFKQYIKQGSLKIIEIDKRYIIPKRFPRGFDYLVYHFLGKPNAVFRNKTLASSDWSQKNLTCRQILCCAFKAVCEYMLIPIVQSAPKTIGEDFTRKNVSELIKKPIEDWECIQTRIKFFKDKNNIIVTYIPNKPEEKVFIAPMLEKLYDGKAYVIGKSSGFFAYGTSLGILITKENITNFKHVSMTISNRIVELHKNEIEMLPDVEESSSDCHKALCLARNVAITVMYCKRGIDPTKGKAKMPSFAKFKPAKFEIPNNVKIPHNYPVYQTILPFSIDKELYPSFILPILNAIQYYQEININISFAQGFDIDDMINSIQIGDISDELESNISKLIDSFPKISAKSLVNDFLIEKTPIEIDEEFYFQILEDPDLTKLNKREVIRFLKMINGFYPQRRKQMISILNLIEYKTLPQDKLKNAELILNHLLCFTKPTLSPRLQEIYSNLFLEAQTTYKSFDNLIKFINKSISVDQVIKNQLVTKIQEAKECFNKFTKNNSQFINEINKINDSITNLSNFKAFKVTENEIHLFIDNANKVLNAIIIYTKFMNSQKNKKIKEIETCLFNIVFNPSDNDSPFTEVYSVYEMHDKFLFIRDSFVNFKSSTGSGKTRCAPFFFSIKALLDNMKYPFFIMTQPGATIIQDKMADFKEHLGKHAIIISNVSQMMKLYQKVDQITQPVIGLFSPFNVLRLLSSIGKDNIISCTRFCLDEIHERSVYTDVLISILSSTMKSRQHFDLQVLMMSATPDPRILHCFGKVKTIEMPDTQLFPIDTIHKEIDSKNGVSKIAAEQAFECIKKMLVGEQQVGHIIIFTSGNSRINEIDNYLSKTYESLKSKSESSLETFNVKLLKNIELDKNFNKDLDKIIKPGDNSLYVIPIKFAGFVSTKQKEIAKQVIKNHKNVIKIIMATNAIESSITINELSVVIDTGLFNQPIYVPQTGITYLLEEPISIQSQTQRRGRVGRVRPGVSVQISIQGLPLKQCLPPEIQITDLSAAILSLRKIGINLEKIDNLPDKLKPDLLKRYMNELYLSHAIDSKSGKITDTGMKISKFESISPFLSSAIIRASCALKLNTDINEELLEILGSLIVLIFSNTELVCNATSVKLQNNFNEDSDIITVLLTFLDCALEVKPRLWKTIVYY